MDEAVNPLERDHFLSVLLPGGLERNATVHGSKPVMDLLVTLCANYRLNPSDYTVEVLSRNKNNISFKPNSAIGLLEAETIVLKPKATEEKIKRPYMPEASVRLLINYNKSHKAVVRVNPRVPLEMLLPAVCDKCELPVETTVLLRDSGSGEPLDLTESLNDLGLREVFAKDTAGKEHAELRRRPNTPEPDLPKNEKKPKGHTGFLSLFRRRKKNGEARGAGSVPASPGLRARTEASSSNNLPADTAMKRRAPQPPMCASQSVPSNLSTCHAGGSQMCAEDTLRRTRRRAPPPPCADTEAKAEVKGAEGSLNPAEELRQCDESDSMNLSLSPSSSSPHPQCSSFSSRPMFAHLHEGTRPSFREMNLSDARCALAKVLTSSVSKATLRLKNSATFPKFSNVSSFMTPRCSDSKPHGAELEPVLTSDLPTEHEAPAQRKGMTTFKVVPLMTAKAREPELEPNQMRGGDDPESEASPEAERNPTEAGGDPPSPDESETQTPLQSPEPSSPETLPPPQPAQDVDDQENQGSPRPEDGGIVEKPTEEGEPEDQSGVAPPDCRDGELPSEAQEDPAECQSPSGEPASADMEETEAEEEVIPEKEEQDLFPPPPPPIFFDEHMEEGEDTTASSLASPQPASPTSSGPLRGFSAHRRHAAAPEPSGTKGAAPSRFAQAVALAVQRCRLQSGGKALDPPEPGGPLP
ncbi:protein cordon-bleu [Pungitius pungitius]|uniref:protein cordon-bleu n=1 Tax=Pungitius pungitius TaxID=134920 RepID=UPI002E14C9CD